MFNIEIMQQNLMVFFFILGGLFLISELLGTGGYLLWCGISALIVGVIVLFFPISIYVAWLLFSFFSLLSVYFWWLWLKKGNHHSAEEKLNQGYQNLIGLETIVTDVFIQGQGRVKVYDGSWKAICDTPLHMNEKVRIIAVNEMILKVEPI